MKKILFLISVLGMAQSCSMVNGITRTAAEAKYYTLGYKRAEDLQKEVDKEGRYADVTCVRDIQQRKWCKLNYYHD